MCDFIFVGVHHTVSKPAAAALPRGRDLSTSTNASLLALLPPKYHAFWLTNSMCSCGFWPPCVGAVGPATFAARQWSQVKIDRAVNDLRAKILAQTLTSDQRETLAWLGHLRQLSAFPIYAHVSRYRGDQNQQAVKALIRVITEADLRAALASGYLNEIHPAVA